MCIAGLRSCLTDRNARKGGGEKRKEGRKERDKSASFLSFTSSYLLLNACSNGLFKSVHHTLSKFRHWLVLVRFLTNLPYLSDFLNALTFSRRRFIELERLLVAHMTQNWKERILTCLVLNSRKKKKKKRTAGWEYDWPIPPRCNSIKFDPIDQAADSLPVITRGRRLIARINHLALITYRYRYFPEVSAIFPLDLRSTRPSLLV